MTSGPDLRGSTPKGGDSFGVVSTIATQKVPEKLIPEPEEAAPSLSKSKDLEPSGKKISLSKPDDRPASPLHRYHRPILTPYNHIYMASHLILTALHLNMVNYFEYVYCEGTVRSPCLRKVVNYLLQVYREWTSRRDSTPCTWRN